MNKKIIFGIVLLLSVGLAIYGYIVLPDVITVQIDLKGNPSNVESKLLGIGTTFAISVIGAIFYYFSEEKGFKFLSISLISCYFSTFIFHSPSILPTALWQSIILTTYSVQNIKNKTLDFLILFKTTFCLLAFCIVLW